MPDRAQIARDETFCEGVHSPQGVGREQKDAVVAVEAVGMWAGRGV